MNMNELVEVFVIAAGGFAFLWWQGIIQPFLKEIACYVAWIKWRAILYRDKGSEL